MYSTLDVCPKVQLAGFANLWEAFGNWTVNWSSTSKIENNTANSVTNANKWVVSIEFLSECLMPLTMTSAAFIACFIPPLINLEIYNLASLPNISIYLTYTNHALRFLSLPSLTSVGSSAYVAYYCYALTLLSLPNLTSNSGQLVEYCYSIVALELPKIASNSGIVCYECASLETLSLPLLTSHNGSGKCVVLNAPSLTELYLPLLTTIIGGVVVQLCNSIRSLSFPSLTSLGTNNAQLCYQCASLESLYVPNLVTLGSSSFLVYYCTKLTELNLPALTICSSIVAYYCNSLITLNLPELTTLNGTAAGYCYSLQVLSAPKLSSLNGNVLGVCYSISTLTLPALTYIGGGVVAVNCTSLQSLYLPVLDNNASGYSVETGCTALVNLYMPSLRLHSTAILINDPVKYIQLPDGFNITGKTISAGYFCPEFWEELATKLFDRSATTAGTMVVGSQNLANIPAATLAQIVAKHWTLS